MVCKKIISVFAACAVFSIAQSAATPDSAGIVEMTHGLAYGGIPYGSVTGMVSKYRQDARQIPYQRQQPQPAHDMVLAMRSRRPGVPTYNGILEPGKPVQIFSHPAVVAPGVVGMMHQVGYQ